MQIWLVWVMLCGVDYVYTCEAGCIYVFHFIAGYSYSPVYIVL